MKYLISPCKKKKKALIYTYKDIFKDHDIHKLLHNYTIHHNIPYFD